PRPAGQNPMPGCTADQFAISRGRSTMTSTIAVPSLHDALPISLLAGHAPGEPRLVDLSVSIGGKHQGPVDTYGKGFATLKQTDGKAKYPHHICRQPDILVTNAWKIKSDADGKDKPLRRSQDYDV